jgi:outer membrane protein assembly factor BamB
MDGMLTAQPAIGLDGTVYLMTNDSTLLAISPDGHELWSQSLCQVMGGGTWPGPAVGSDGTVYGVCKGEDIYALDPKSGTILWTYHTNDQMESTPIPGDNGLVYFASTGGQVIAMQPDGKPRWQNSVAGLPGYIQMIDAPVVRGPNGLIFVTPRHGSIYTLDPKTGEILWSAKIGGQGVGINPVSVAVDGSVYARNLNGELFCISPSGNVRWKIDPISEDFRFSPPVTGSHGELYLGIENQLIAFQTDTK